MTKQDVIKNIMSNYNLDFNEAMELVRSGEKQGFSYQAIYTGIRMAFGAVTGQENYFSAADLAEAFGVSEDEMIQQLEDMKKELIEQGENPDDYFTKVEPEQVQRFVILPEDLEGNA